jgi:hypothetical protein
MAINETMLSEVVALATDHEINALLHDELKRAFPNVRFTLCSEDDIHAGKPVVEKEGFDIYLVGSSEHCLTLTNDIDLATGIVIAEKYTEE